MDERVERQVQLPASPDEVWEALTDRLGEWYGAEADLEAVPGGRVTFHHPDGTEERGIVERAVPGRELVFRRLPFVRDPDGTTRPAPARTVRFVITPAPGGSVLWVTETKAAPSRPIAGGHLSPRSLAGAHTA